ncbi:MAG TPA: ATP-binding protein [Longimicrobiales bacterium]
MSSDSQSVPPLSDLDEQMLRASDAIIAISADAIITIDEAQNIIRFNRGAEEIFGYTPDEILGRSIDLLIPHRFRAAHPEQVRGFAESPVIARRMGERRQISGLRRNGEEFPAEASISKTRLGNRWIFTVALRDVTDRMRVEQAQRFLAQATAVLSGSLDTAHNLQAVASYAVPLLGDWCVVFLSNGTQGVRRAAAVHADPRAAEDMQRLLELPFGGHADHPLMVSLTSGEPLFIEDFTSDVMRAWSEHAAHARILERLAPRSVIAAPMRARGRTIGVLCFFRGGTGRVHDQDDLELATEIARRAALALDNARLYAEAQAAVLARDDVLAIVSHDLGNPLAAIRLASTVLNKLLTRRGAQPDALQQVENIRASVAHMDRLIRDLLDVKRIEAGFLALEKERVRIPALLAEVSESYAPIAAARSIELRTDGVVDDVLLADRERLLQVFSNLVGNALKFTPPGGHIILAAARNGQTVRFTIADTGPGIPAENLPHVFDRFWQARRTGRHGIGLGLAIVKGIVDAHGGSIHIASELGAGTTFTVELPTG